MLHRYLYLSFLPNVYFPYYAFLFFTLTLGLKKSGTPTGLVFLVLAVLSYALHLLFSVERLASSLALALYGAALLWRGELEPTPAGDNVVWTFLFALPTCAHNVSALNQVKDSTYATLALGALLLGLGAWPVVRGAESDPLCRHPRVFAAACAHLAMCVFAKSGLCLLAVFPAQCALLTRHMWDTDSERDYKQLGDAEYTRFRAKTSPCVPVPQALYARMPLTLRRLLFENIDF